VKLIDAQIEKEVKEGTFYTDSSTQETLKKFERQVDEELLENDKQKDPFEKSPPE
jgi:hypothetical protein